VGVLGAIVGFLLGSAFGDGGHSWRTGLDVAIIIFYGFTGLGLLSACIALARFERWWPVTVLGLVLNSLPVVKFVCGPW
jgi:hypothetical protein